MKQIRFFALNVADAIAPVIGTVLFFGACILPGVFVWKASNSPIAGLFDGLGIFACLIMFYDRQKAPDNMWLITTCINIASLALLFAAGIFTFPEWLPLPDSWYWAR